MAGKSLRPRQLPGPLTGTGGCRVQYCVPSSFAHLPPTISDPCHTLLLFSFSSRDFPTLTHLGLNKHSPSIRSAQMLLNINIKLYIDMGLSTRKNWLSLARWHQRLSVQESQRQQSVTDVITRPSFQKCSQQTHVPLSR